MPAPSVDERRAADEELPVDEEFNDALEEAAEDPAASPEVLDRREVDVVVVLASEVELLDAEGLAEPTMGLTRAGVPVMGFIAGALADVPAVGEDAGDDAVSLPAADACFLARARASCCCL